MGEQPYTEPLLAKESPNFSACIKWHWTLHLMAASLRG